MRKLKSAKKIMKLYNLQTYITRVDAATLKAIEFAQCDALECGTMQVNDVINKLKPKGI